jgi:hypothetical protein
MPETEHKSSTLLLILCWLIVGLPAAWGVEQTVVKSAALFTASHTAPTTNTK